MEKEAYTVAYIIYRKGICFQKVNCRGRSLLLGLIVKNVPAASAFSPE